MQQAISDYAAEKKQEEEWALEQLREKEMAAQEAVRRALRPAASSPPPCKFPAEYTVERASALARRVF